MRGEQGHSTAGMRTSSGGNRMSDKESSSAPSQQPARYGAMAAQCVEKGQRASTQAQLTEAMAEERELKRLEVCEDQWRTQGIRGFKPPQTGNIVEK